MEFDEEKRVPSLVLGLWDSCKYMYSDMVIIKDHVEPDPLEHPVPKFLCAPGSLSF